MTDGKPTGENPPEAPEAAEPAAPVAPATLDGESAPEPPEATVGEPPEPAEPAEPAESAAESSEPAETEPAPEEDDQGIADTLRRVQSRFMAGLLLAYAVAAGVGIGTVVLFGVRDWFLFVAMYLVVLAYLSAYLKAHQRRRPVLKLISLVSTVALTVFWCFILIDRIPARKVFDGGEVVTREAMGTLWISVALLLGVCVGLLVHVLYVGRPGPAVAEPEKALVGAPPDTEEQGA